MSGNAVLPRSSVSPQVQNQVDKALSRPVNPHTLGDWRLTGPTRNDGWVIMEGARQLA